MLKYNFKKIFKAQGIERPFTYLKNAGLSDHFANKIVHEKIRDIRLNELEKLCVILRCSPNDVIEWIPDSLEGIEEKHPLRKCLKTKYEIDMVSTLRQVPLDKIREIEALIKEKIQEDN